MTTLVTYQHTDAIATITMDDGKANALSPNMFAELGSALDHATADGAAVVLTGREGMFSGGFDLSVLKGGGSDATSMVRAGFELAERLLSFPAPVVIACPGHAIAMGLFLLLSGDYRVGAAGAFRLMANEVAIGLTIPLAAVEICRQRLAPAQFNRAVILAEPFSPEEAIAAGMLDRVVPGAQLQGAAGSIAAQLAQLDRAAHAGSKLRARDQALKALRSAIEADFAGV